MLFKQGKIQPSINRNFYTAWKLSLCVQWDFVHHWWNGEHLFNFIVWKTDQGILKNLEYFPRLKGHHVIFARKLFVLLKILMSTKFFENFFKNKLISKIGNQALAGCEDKNNVRSNSKQIGIGCNWLLVSQSLCRQTTPPIRHNPSIFSSSKFNVQFICS